MDKLLQHYIKSHFDEYLIKNNIIQLNHHGPRREHGTSTATIQINYELCRNYEFNNISAVVLTDLSAAFNKVDTDILLAKLNYYRINGKELKLFNSFITNHRQYVSQ